jgi:hypothetical protein
MRTFRYEVIGTAARAQTWKASGYVKDPNNDLREVFEEVMQEAFMQLTKGKAVYGQPGVGCQGPYTFDKITIQRDFS